MSTHNWGRNLNIEIFGKSHDDFIGVRLNGIPAGEIVDIKKLTDFMERRSPGKKGTSQRKEADIPDVISGISDGKTDGSCIEIIIRNTDVRSSDYDSLKDIPRPGHADYPAYVRSNGKEDLRGGGEFSGRMTAPMCAAGGIAKQILSRRGIEVSASMTDRKFPIPQGDSVGGIVECHANGLPIGLGGALFDGLESIISPLVFAIPAVKGVEFGAGFKSAAMLGSENNDQYEISDGEVSILSNNSGGILGGMATGQELIMRVAFKPTPSIAVPQKSVNLKTKENIQLEIKGRHDPCVAVRAVPAVEAAVSLALLDCLLENDAVSLREKIDLTDTAISLMLKKRFELTDEIGKIKAAAGTPVRDEKRERCVRERVEKISGAQSGKDISDIFDYIMEKSRERQEKNWNSD